MFFLVTMKNGRFSKDQNETLELNRRQTAALERIAAALEKKSG
jgi:hypothetical protein